MVFASRAYEVDVLALRHLAASVKMIRISTSRNDWAFDEPDHARKAAESKMFISAIYRASSSFNYHCYQSGFAEAYADVHRSRRFDAMSMKEPEKPSIAIRSSQMATEIFITGTIHLDEYKTRCQASELARCDALSRLGKRNMSRICNAH